MKKKILIIGFTKIKYMPYMNFYLENLVKHESEIHILYWNRDLKEENLSEYESFTLHEFQCYQEDDVSKISKISSFIKYRKFACKVIQEYEFDFIFVLHSLPGVLISDILTRKYKGKFILDYRDFTYEKINIFKRMVGNLVKNSKITFVSSDAFRKILPKSENEKIFTSHNLLIDSLKHRNEKKQYGVKSDRIRIAFWGFIRHEEINKVIIEKISKDKRFELHYYGREQRIAYNLKEYVKEIAAENVFFHGEYKPQDRYKFVRETDIIHNVYEDNNTMLAMGNKYYDSIIFYIPLMSMCGSYMAKKAEKAGIGFTVNPYEKNFMNKLYESYHDFNRDSFIENCDKELDRVCKEYYKGKDIIRNTVFKEN